MKILTMEIRLYTPWIQSLKEKRMVVKSILAKLINTFHVSAAEIDCQDVHKTIVIGVASIVSDNANADWMEEKILECIDLNSEAQIMDSISEIR